MCGNSCWERYVAHSLISQKAIFLEKSKPAHVESAWRKNDYPTLWDTAHPTLWNPAGLTLHRFFLLSPPSLLFLLQKQQHTLTEGVSETGFVVRPFPTLSREPDWCFPLIE